MVENYIKVYQNVINKHWLKEIEKKEEVKGEA